MRPDEVNDLLDTLNYHLANSPLTVIEWDHEFRVKRWSGQAESVFGWRESDVMGKNPGDWQFVHEDDAAAVNDVMAALLTGDEPRNISRNRNFTQDGRLIHCEWYNSVLTDKQGNLLSVLSLAQDVTERELADAKIRQLQKMESVGQLTGGVSHDFNNLLTVILGNAELLAEQLIDQPLLSDLARTVVTAANKGAVLTQQLLAFSRQQPLSPQSIIVNDLLYDMHSILERTLGEHVEMAFIGDDDLFPALVDPVQLESALLNLCLNARDAMPGGGKLTVESLNVTLDEPYAAMHEEVVPGEYVMVGISDTGSGMSEDVLAKAFEPFFTTKPTGKGSGLGLSMVFGFIKQSNGHIKLYSEPGEGTTVKMYLPRSTGEVQEISDAGLPLTSLTGTETILLVEDDETVRDYAAAQLRALGYKVTTASNGVVALEILAGRDDFDLLFTDVVMPGGINGPELARKAQKLHPDLPVLYTSGYTRNAIVHHGRLDPGVLLLSKPYQRVQLARMIRKSLQ